MQIGQTLRDARLQRGIDLNEVQRVTKIRVQYLRAMEEDQWEAIPSPDDARNFLATYARFLDLDEAALLEKYRPPGEGQERAEPVSRGVIRPGGRDAGGRHRPRGAVLVALAAAALLVLGVVVVASLGSSSDNENGQRAQSRTGTASSTGTTTTSAPRSELSVQLSATADVWVCLVDDSGQSLVNGLTLTTGQSQGPFTGRGFEVRFGNGSVQMTVNGEAASIPPSASPVDYRIGSSGVKPLAPGSGPTCT